MYGAAPAGRKTHAETRQTGTHGSPQLEAGRKRSTMFAIIESGGKQYRVQEGDVIKVEKLSGEEGSSLEFASLMGGGTVKAEVLSHGKHPKIYINKYKSGIQYRRRTGHRQQFTALKITGVSDK